jgi:hypothetical protein
MPRARNREIELKCRRVRSLLSAFADDELDHAIWQAVDRHLVSCASCREEHEILQSVIRTVDRANPHVSCPTGVWESLSARIASAPPPTIAASSPAGRGGRQIAFQFAPPWAVAAALLLGIALHTPPAPTPVRASSNDSIVSEPATRPVRPYQIARLPQPEPSSLSLVGHRLLADSRPDTEFQPESRSRAALGVAMVTRPQRDRFGIGERIERAPAQREILQHSTVPRQPAALQQPIQVGLERLHQSELSSRLGARPLHSRLLVATYPTDSTFSPHETDSSRLSPVKLRAANPHKTSEPEQRLASGRAIDHHTYMASVHNPSAAARAADLNSSTLRAPTDDNSLNGVVQLAENERTDDQMLDQTSKDCWGMAMVVGAVPGRTAGPGA